MTIRYYYEFADGFTATLTKEMTFSVLKIAIDGHGPLVKMKKIAVIHDKVDEVEITT